MDQRLSVWSFSAPELEPNGLLRTSEPDSNCSHSHDLKLQASACASDPREDADPSQKDETDVPGQAATKDGFTSVVLHTENTSRGSQSREEVDDWFNTEAFEKAPLEDVDADVETPAISSKRPGPSQRRQANNREHQRRWRLRQKARSQAVQKQLATAAAELAELKRRQEQLEAKSHVHTSHMQLHQATAEHAFPMKEPIGSTKGSPEGKPFVPAICLDAGNKPTLYISLGGNKLPAASEEISRMSVQDFAALWTAYNIELRECLVYLNRTPDPQAEVKMQQLAFEALRLCGCRLLLNPAVHHALVNGQMTSSHDAQHQLDQTFYISLLIVLALSAEQIQDLMLVRLLYHTKRSLLSQKRREIMNQMSEVEDQRPHPCEHVIKMTELSMQLKDNSSENHQLYYLMARVMYRGLLTSRQLADIIVHSYPYMPMTEILLDTIAAQAGYPNQQQIEVAANHDPLDADWKLFGDYAKFITSHESHDYIQMCRHSGNQRWWLHQCHADPGSDQHTFS